MSDRPPGSRMAAFRRWAAILLPFVVFARVILLVSQLRDERRERAHANDPPPWPPVAGEELRFRSNNPHVAGWVDAPDRPRLVVQVTQRDYLPTDPGTGCVLDPSALQRHQGTLTVRSQTAEHRWRADWSGGATMPTLAEDQKEPDLYLQRTEAYLLRGDAPAPNPGSDLQAVERNLLRAADCSGDARLELGEWDLHALVNLLAGQPLPPDQPPSRRDLRILVDRPPP